MKKWKPINFRGAYHEDPRKEVGARAKYAAAAGDTYVAIPIELAMAVNDHRECAVTRIIIQSGDQSLKIATTPEIYICRKPEGHLYPHYNGYLNWEQKEQVVVVTRE